MRHIRVLQLVGLLASVLMMQSGAVIGQAAVRRFEPPIIRVQLTSAPQKLENAFSIQPYTFTGSEGFPSGTDFVGHTDKLYWFDAPADFTYLDEYHGIVPLVSFNACGFTSKAVPKDTLTFPSGRQLSLMGRYSELEIQQSEPFIGGRGCWNYTFDWTYGMELGLYTFTVTSSQQGELRHTWAIDNPFCPAVSQIKDKIDHTFLILMGFEPNEKLTIWLYATDKNQPNASWQDVLFARTFAAKVDAEGALLLNISATPDAPFNLKEPIGYTIQKATGGIYFGVGQDDSSSRVAPNYPCTGHFSDQQAQVASDAPLYPAADSSSKVSSTLKAGTPVQILEDSVSSLNGRTILWYHVQTSDGQEGWVYGPKPYLTFVSGS